MENLQIRGMREMDEKQLQETNGGLIGLLIVGGIVLVGLAVGAYVGYKEAEADAQKK